MNNVTVSPERVALQQSPSEGRVIDLRYLFPILLNWSWIVVLAMGLATAKGLWDMHTFHPKYVATMVVAPMDEGQVGISPGAGASGLAQGLLSLGGVGGRATTTFDRLVHLTSTLALAQRFQDKYGLLQVIYADSWDEKTKTWIKPRGAEFERAERIKGFFNLPTWSEPDLEDLARYLGSSFTVAEEKGTQFRRISFTHGNPELALRLLRDVYSEASALLRETTRKEIAEQKRHLQERLDRETRLDIQATLRSLLGSLEQREMMMHGNLPFAARIIDAPYISKHRSQPDKLRFLILPVMIAFALSVTGIVVIALMRSE